MGPVGSEDIRVALMIIIGLVVVVIIGSFVRKSGNGSEDRAVKRLDHSLGVSLASLFKRFAG